MEIHRFNDWHDRLKQYFAEVAEREFEWGEHDCALFASGAVAAMTGHDIAAPFRGHYSTALGSVRALHRYGAGTLEATVSASLGKPQHISQAKRGDVVAYAGALGICCGSKCKFIGDLDDFFVPVIADGREPVKGLVQIATKLCDHSWAVPY